MPLRVVRTLWVALLLAGAVQAQPLEQLPSVYLDESIDARTRLNTAEAFLRDGQWAEALELLQSLIETGGGRIVRVGPDRPNLFVSLRDYSQRRIAQLPPEGLRLYRERVDGQAADLLRRAEATQDAGLYRRIADEMLCSSSGDRAVERLGDLAFSAGRFVEASAWWARLLPVELIGGTAGDTDVRLRHPDPKTDLPRVAAKWAIARAYIGDNPSAARGAAYLHEHHSTAAGRLAGRTGPYCQTVSELLKSVAAEAPAADADWATFAGDFRRSRIAPGPIEIGDVQWTWPVRDKQAKAGARAGGIEPIIPRAEEELVYHPIVVGEQVVLATERNLWSFDLRTGKADRWFEFTDVDVRNGGAIEVSQQTISAADGRLYVRVGGGAPRIPVNQFRTLRFRPSSKLYCFDLATQRELWSVNSPEIGDGNAVFEGAPVVADGLAVIAMTRSDAMSQTAVVGLEASTGELRWRTVVCEAPNEDAVDDPRGGTLLSLVDDTVYYGTNMGAVAALNVRNGGLRWVAVYPRRDRSLARFRRPDSGLNPCVVHSNKVFLAAADAERIQCYDAETGVKLWDSPIPFVHLLGVAKGNLIATGNRVWAIDVETGKVRWYWPENTAGGYGRGVLAGEHVYWPTFSEIHVLDQATGRKVQSSVPLFDRLGIKAGNMVVGNGVLILAQAERLLAIYPYSRLIKKLEAELVANPNAAGLHYQLAQAAFGHGDLSTAERHFALAARHARVDEMMDGARLAELARRKLVAARREGASALEKVGKLEEADQAYRRAADAADTPADRAGLLRDLALLWQTAGRPERAIEVLQLLLDGPEFRTAVVNGELKVRIPAAVWAEQTQRTLIARHGRSIYEAIDRRAQAARQQAKTPEQLLALAEHFPFASERAAALSSAGRSFEQSGRRRDALRTYRLLVERTPAEPPVRLEALLGLHRLYKTAADWENDRMLLDRVAREFADRPTLLAEGLPISRWASAERAAIDRLSAAPGTRAPVFRKLAEATAAEGHYVFPDGSPPPGLPPMSFFTAANRLVCRTIGPATPDRQVWAAEAAAEPDWLGYSSAGLLVATAERLLCLEYSSGSVLWERPRLDASEVAWAGTPVPRAEYRAEDAANPPPAPSDQSYVVAGTVVIEAGPRGRLRGIDVDQGTPLWETEAGTATAGARLQLAGSLLCLSSADRLIGVEPLTGVEKLSLALRGPATTAAVRPDRLVAIVARDELATVDPASGAIAWRSKLLWPARHAPRVFADAGRLLVLVDGFQLLSLDPQDGRELWSTALCPAPAEHLAADLAAGTFVYTLGGELIGRDAATGKVRWQRALPLSTEPVVRAAGDRTLVFGAGAALAQLLVVSTTDGRPLQALAFPDAGPKAEWTLADGLCFVVSPRITWVLDRPGGGTKTDDGRR